MKEKLTDEEIFNIQWKRGGEFIKEFFDTLEGIETFNMIYENLIEALKGKEFTINVDKPGEVEKFLVFFLNNYDENLTEDKEKLHEEADEIVKKLKKIGVNKLNPFNKNDFFTFFSIFSVVIHENLMRIGFLSKVLLNLPDKEYDRITRTKIQLKELLEQEKSNRTIMQAVNQEIYTIFLETGGVDFWVGKAYDLLTKKSKGKPVNKDLVFKLAEQGFNGYLQEIFGDCLPELHLKGVASEEFEQEEDNFEDLAMWAFLGKDFGKYLN